VIGHTTYTTAVVVIPPTDLWPPLQAIRRRYDRQARRWMPHITLLYPFRPRSAFDELTAQFAAVCQAIAPFEVALAEFGLFRRPREHTLWLSPEPKEPLTELQTALWRVVPDCDATRRHSGGFTPHLSVGQAQGAEAAEILAQLRGDWTSLRFVVDAVHLIWRGDPPDDVFRVGRSVALAAC
jgi:RNA 2',3'-cyclic 3'-phosphodiesterase